MKHKKHFLFLFLIGIGLLFVTGCSRGHRVASILPPPPPPAPVLRESFPVHRLTLPPQLPLAIQPQFDPVQDVIEKAEAAFQRGEKAYSAGHLEMAKTEFNSAVLTLIPASAAPREDKRLGKAFDSLVDRIHAYEIEALRQGDGFAEPSFQPSPLDELKTLTFPEDPQLSERVRAEAASTVSDIPLVINSQVASFIQYFTSGRGRATIQATLQRSGRFRDMILRVLDEEGVPLDLLYLTQAESGFQPMARSRAGALGLWQFMPARGKEYGLERNWWMDERLNPEKATRAAARHLKDLYNTFGDWYLAMAAYNCGPQCVQRAVERTGYADFWELAARQVLPKETRNYVPIIVALTVVSKNLDKYGLEEVLPETPWVYDTVEVSEPVDLRLVSEIVGTGLENIRTLNPSLLRTTTPKVPSYTLRIPLATKNLFLKRIAMIPPEKRVWWRWHTVHYGETLSWIAQKFKTSVKAIAEVNNLDPKEPLWEAADLVIPVTSSGTPGPGGSGAPMEAGAGHRVRPGDTLSSIARRYSVTINQLMAWNDLDGTTIRAGSTLKIRPEDSAFDADEQRTQTVSLQQGPVVHRVRKGESLSQIATNYNTSVAAIQRTNRHLGRVLQVGDQVTIPSSK